MDTSHVALVSLNLCAEGFDHYHTETSMVLGVDVSTLYKIMRLANSTDSITLSASGENPAHLDLLFENPEDKRTTEFSMKLISVDVEVLAIPETEYSSVVSINSIDFQRICKELEYLSDTVTISSQFELVQFSFESESATGSISLGLGDKVGNWEQATQELTVAVKQKYAIRYLNMFNKAAPLSTFTHLCLHNE